VVVADARSRIKELDGARDAVRSFSVMFEPLDFSGELAEEIVGIGDELERLGAAIKLVAARRVEETGHHEHQGDKSAGRWLARKTGESEGASIAELETLKAAERHPVVESALRRGELSTGRAR
jgi:hypothetical protein